ncbi:nitronate monooxygenase family protein [Mycobacterium xenopi 3993]|nr:nitronate monooxygenase family protein [Mycobacterium xenopi 3993]
MRTPLCDRFGIDYPIFVFTPSEKVAAAVSRAGGFGVLGCVRFNDADELEPVLQWMDANTDGKPYGVDVVMPAKIPTEGAAPDLDKLIPQAHREFVDKTAAALGVPPLPADEKGSAGVLGWLHSVARSHVEVALNHPIKLIANALGSPPTDVIEQAHQAGCRWRRWLAPPRTPVATSTTVSTSWWPRAMRPAATPERSRRWCWCQRSVTRSGFRCWRRVGSAPASTRRGLGAGRVRVWMGSAFLARPNTTWARATLPEFRSSSKRCWPRARATPCVAGSTAASRHGCSRAAGPTPGTPRRA